MNFKKHFLAYLLIGISTLSLVQCSKDSEILATYDGGTVTRGEMNFVIEASKRGQAESQPVSPDIQLKILESIALEKILLLDGIQSKKVDPADVKKIETLVSDFLKFNVYMREYTKEAVKTKPLEFVDLQIALIRGADPAENEKKADELLSKLNSASKAEVSKLISENTADVTRKPVGGKLEPFCVNCSITPLEDIISEARKVKKGQFVKYSKEKENQIIYLVRITGDEKVHPERVVKYLTSVFEDFKDEATKYGASITPDEETKNAISYFTEGNLEEKGQQFAQHTLKQFEQGLYQKEMTRLKEVSGIEVNPIPPVFGPEGIDPKNYGPDLVLYTKKDKSTYTWKDLENDFASVPNALKSEYKDPKLKIWDMLNLFQSTLLQGKIAQETPEVQKISKETSYLMQLDKMRVSLALKAFQDEVKSVPVNVTEQQLRDSYEAGKLYAYSTPDPKNPQNRITQSYAQVRERIKSEMEGAQRNAFVEQKISGLKTTYNLKVAQDRLKEVTL
ncbi:hypothetical protein LPTSP3_g18020 [Leptospira kobayashii]|uniref:Lipoprotein n=1 Tax=Leptospira kobayashii TaxID=1917830 RepID=A0ABM7UJH1_9LEPT|nr:hypothetical protein [Leptospira kobayashii]BDA78872.1 hypothetical protein LPTSP3_g18020 [Leptospira kobayashii]